VKVAYIIPCALGHTQVGFTLDHVMSQSQTPAEVVVVANGWDGRRLPSQSGVRVLSIPRNVGYDAACNLGILSTSSPYVALINDDALLPERWGEQLTGIMDRERTLAALTGVSDPGNGQPVCAGSRWNKRFQAVETDDPGEVEFLNFTAVLLRREALLRAGFFPERYFTYYEDVDATLRFTTHGYRVRSIPEIRVAHAPSTSAPILGSRRWALLLRNRYWTLCRHYGFGFLLRHFPHLFHGDLILWKKLILRPDLLISAYASIPAFPRWSHG